MAVSATVFTSSDAPKYVQDVFPNFKEAYPAPKQSQTNKPEIIRIGLIGAGPSGLSLLNAFNKELSLKNKSVSNFEIICFEKQSDISGQWNYNWRTGTDEYGTMVHTSMYRHLWSNGPKECLEMSDYTFDQHFNGQNIGSFPPLAVLRDYIIGRVKANELNKKFEIRLNHNITEVKQTSNDKFEVAYHNLQKDTFGTELFDYLIVATGHFSVPNVVEFTGFDTFNGRILHSHCFRNASEFKNQNILVIGGSYSAEDIALQCWKFGAKNVTISNRRAMGFKWPKGVNEVPLLREIVNGSDAVLVNGEIVRNIDSIILCTGYKHSFPFLPNELRLNTNNILYPKGLYKGCVWLSNPKLFYLGMADQWYTFTMFDLQSLFVKDVILDRIELPTQAMMKFDAFEWSEREETRVKSDHDKIHFQTDYILELYSQLLDPSEYIDDAKKLDYSHEFEEWEEHKEEDILSYRDKRFRSKVSGVMATQFHPNWARAFDDSMENFIGTQIKSKL